MGATLVVVDGVVLRMDCSLISLLLDNPAAFFNVVLLLSLISTLDFLSSPNFFCCFILLSKPTNTLLSMCNFFRHVSFHLKAVCKIDWAVVLSAVHSPSNVAGVGTH